MKRITISIVSIVVVISLILNVLPVMAGKPLDVIYKSNGFPSGKHFNLNLHGRDPLTWTGDPGDGGNSVFVSLSGNSTIQYLSNKKNFNATKLTVLDPLTEDFGPHYDPAQVYLPYNIYDESDNTTKSADGYYVFGRILAKPNNGKNESPSSILLYPNLVVASANATDNTTDSWPFYPFDPDSDLLGLGLITTQGNLYINTPQGFERFDPPTDDPYEKGKGQKRGKSKATEITELFKWSGYVSDNLTLDTDGDGLDMDDVPLDWEAIYGNPIDGVVSQAEFEAWLDYLVSIGEAIKYDGAWIFDIADMVISGQTVINDGTKLFQIRFYPVATTEFR